VTPSSPALGLADSGVDALGQRVLGAWDAFLDVAGAADLERPSRLEGWSGTDLCIHLGTWEDNRPLEELVTSARAGSPTVLPPMDDANERLVAAHRGAGPDEVLDAVRHSRDELARFFASLDAAELGRTPASSILGPLPLLALVHAGCYELAVHALDLAPCGAPEPEPELLSAGVASLIDSLGALAARRELSAAVTAQTPAGGWRFESGGSGWRTEPVAPGPVDGAAVSAPAGVLLDVSAGRASLGPLLASGQVRLQDVRAFVRLAPVIEDLPGIPGGEALQRAARGLGSASRLAGRLPRLPFWR
jgi:uncharacterized protein (TIGR03083 family)